MSTYPSPWQLSKLWSADEKTLYGWKLWESQEDLELGLFCQTSVFLCIIIYWLSFTVHLKFRNNYLKGKHFKLPPHEHTVVSCEIISFHWLFNSRHKVIQLKASNLGFVRSYWKEKETEDDKIRFPAKTRVTGFPQNHFCICIFYPFSLDFKYLQIIIRFSCSFLVSVLA